MLSIQAQNPSSNSGQWTDSARGGVAYVRGWSRTSGGMAQPKTKGGQERPRDGHK
ncbi:MAG: hypothetical protein ABI878_15050 [Acidobacteriota bacterium]